jgi:hypothetical protein
MGRVAVVIGLLALMIAPSVGARVPNERGELTAASHGDRDWAYLDSYDWCPRGEDLCQSVFVDYAAPDHWDRLPIHPGGLMRLRTGRSAGGVSVHFPGNHRSAKRRGDPGRRWRVRVPQSTTRKMFLRIVVDYRRGKYRFFLPVRQHRHN